MKIDFKFFLLRRKLGLSDFLSKFATSEDAFLYLEDKNFFNVPTEEIVEHFDRIKKKAKSSGRKPRKKATRRPRKKKVETKKNDASYFETWKVPYVEPE